MADNPFGAVVLAEGEGAVLDFLRMAGIPDYATDSYFDQADRGDIGRWPSGTWLADGEGSSETLMATVSLDEQGICRVERGPADLFWELTSPPDDDDES